MKKITEEQATKSILDWLESNDWKIICFDFPQSGTGVSLHPNQNLRTSKNKGTFIPDIVAIKDENVAFFENKDRFILSDFEKIKGLRKNNDYSNSINRLLKGYNFKNIYYGVGLVYSNNTEKKVNLNLEKVDFVIYCHADRSIIIYFDPMSIYAPSAFK